MQNPIPSPRRSDGVRPMPRLFPPLPRRTPLVGPVCPRCEHPSCRVRRAQRLPRLGGHRSEFSREHAQAAAIQKRHRHLIVYYGEATQSFWAVTPTGLLEAANADALLLALWPHNAPFMPPALAVEALTPVPA
ncbi:hypothetical protein [Nocardiopsis dassonvillei]|uniref:hypothetical protein n=1 Tax=Nocardiopsis dassonvillei TaxID=2014 RepID=UPI000B9D7D0A|nr:hypothetical protein [Nocardiopsis dassonvillei]ASU59901.1 hypothetical protein CGQ36_21090 [Nocardiopsis dassonvillei]